MLVHSRSLHCFLHKTFTAFILGLELINSVVFVRTHSWQTFTSKSRPFNLGQCQRLACKVGEHACVVTRTDKHGHAQTYAHARAHTYTHIARNTATPYKEIYGKYPACGPSDWTGVKKAVLEEAKGQVNQTTEDLLFWWAYLFVESIGKIP